MMFRNRVTPKPNVEGKLLVVLTKGYVATVDDTPKVRSILTIYKFWTLMSGETPYACTVVQDSTKKNGQRKIFLHHLILGVGPRWRENIQTDHIDNDTMNNSADNLRVVSKRINMINRRKSKSNTSGVVGISRDISCNRWKARLVIKDGSRICKNFKDVIYGDMDSSKKAAIRWLEEKKHTSSLYTMALGQKPIE